MTFKTLFSSIFQFSGLQTRINEHVDVSPGWGRSWGGNIIIGSSFASLPTTAPSRVIASTELINL